MNQEQKFEDIIGTCFKCNGAAVGKTGKPCKRCQGTGKVSDKFMDSMKQFIQTQVLASQEETFQKLLAELKHNKPEALVQNR